MNTNIRLNFLRFQLLCVGIGFESFKCLVCAFDELLESFVFKELLIRPGITL
jgi:hypothetical protein